MKRIITIQDISCLGKCSLTVALPILSAMGVETCVVPTAVLSTHTMFSGYTFRDLTEDLPGIADHWEKEGFAFDAVYTGYLGSRRQLGLVEDYFRRFGRSALKLVDPVMADNGSLYAGFTPDFALEMAKLCGKADVILPNLTEAAFLLDRPYLAPGTYSEAQVKDTLKALCDLGAGTAVLTGVSFSPGEIGFMSLEAKTGAFDAYFHPRVEASYHGTGDIFASVVTGGLMLGKGLGESLRLAADYTADCIRVTAEDPQGIRYGVYFEALIPELVKRLGE
jgi:pyridoxine kinase